MESEWINDYLNSTETIRNDYYQNRSEFGYNDTAEAVKLSNKRYYAFIVDNELRLFIGSPLTWKLVDGKIPAWERRSIPLANIQYFSREGDIYTETKISGGSSPGFNLKGAVIGGIIGGTAGAIIGGQGRIDPVKSETIRHDDRKTILVHNGGKVKLSTGDNATLGEGTLEFAPEDYSVLMKLIPDKELSVVQQRRAGEKGPSQPDPADQLRKLKSLHDDGLITDEEFEEKRKKIVNSL